MNSHRWMDLEIEVWKMMQMAFLRCWGFLVQKLDSTKAFVFSLISYQDQKIECEAELLLQVYHCLSNGK